MAIEIKSCRSCKKLFQYISGDVVCPNCRKLVEEDFKKVKEYIWTNKGCTIQEVSEACEVSPKMIKYWLREGRLELESPSVELTCDKCNKPISSGKMCSKCTAELQNVLMQFTKTVKGVSVTPTSNKVNDKFYTKHY